MRVKSIVLNQFRRFESLSIRDIPKTTKLVVLAGPNGSGKSSLFDAFLMRYKTSSEYGWNNDLRYYNRNNDMDRNIYERILIKFHENKQFSRGSLYIRGAHRHDPEFSTNSLIRQGGVLERLEMNRLIEADATVHRNYMRLASQAMQDVFVTEAASTTMGDYRDRLIGEIREPLQRLFPDLIFIGVGNPLDQGTFQFKKGIISDFDYKNLSGGEKAAFDLILDFAIKKGSFMDAIYCIDEPEIHMNTKIQGALLGELFGLLPASSQLWIASHSIGMMRKARELYESDPKSVAFLDFGGHDFDCPTVITPSKPTRVFWEGVMNVALDDLAALIAPREVVICEGNPASPVSGKNAEHDARIYTTIFSEEFPDVTFISAGSANQVSADFLGLAAALPKIATGMRVKRLIDRDDHAISDIMSYESQGIKVLGRRNIESYLFDDEVLAEFCLSLGKSSCTEALLLAKAQAIRDSISRGNPPDDIKSASGTIYAEAKKILGVTQIGNDRNSFSRNTLAPLIRPNLRVYTSLKHDIFGF